MVWAETWSRTLAVCVGLLLTLTPSAGAQEDEGLLGGPQRTPYGAKLEATGALPLDETQPQAAPPKFDVYAEGIVLRGSPAFVLLAAAELDALQRTEAGRAILEQISASGRTTTIAEIGDANAYVDAADRGAILNADGTPGAGSNSTISWNPNFRPGGLPSGLILGHELIHALHNALGINDNTPITDPLHPDFGVRLEELRTVGVPPHDEENPLTENALRAQWNELFSTRLPHRETYLGSGWSPSGLYTPREFAAEQLRREQGPPELGEPRRGAVGALNDQGGAQ